MNSGAEKKSFTELKIEKAKKYINSNYSKKIYLKDVADYVCYNSHYFSKLFKKVEKVNFNVYLNNIRLEKSKEYIENTDLTFREISKKVGYEDFSYFTLVFQKYVGVLPSEYRKKMRNG